jgi:hypothetical protein
MPGEFSDTGGKRALDAVTGRATVTSRTTYLALLTAAPSDATTDGTITMTEYAATGYARQTVAWTAPALNGSSVPESSNSGVLTFGPFTAGTGGVITHAALVSAVSGTTGDLLAWWSLDASRTPATNDSISIAANALKLAVE